MFFLPWIFPPVFILPIRYLILHNTGRESINTVSLSSQICTHIDTHTHTRIHTHTHTLFFLCLVDLHVSPFCIFSSFHKQNQQKDKDYERLSRPSFSVIHTHTHTHTHTHPTHPPPPPTTTTSPPRCGATAR